MLATATAALLDLLSLAEVSLPALFIISLLSATLLPMGSEPAVFAVVKLNPSLFWPAVLVATAGNTAGGAIGSAVVAEAVASVGAADSGSAMCHSLRVRLAREGEAPAAAALKGTIRLRRLRNRSLPATLATKSATQSWPLRNWDSASTSCSEARG